MKKNLLIALTCFTTAVLAQTSVKIDNGIALLDGKQWLVVQETPIDKMTNYEVVKNLSGEIIAVLTFINNSDKVFFKGEFPTVAKKYEINYPSETTILTYPLILTR